MNNLIFNNDFTLFIFDSQVCLENVCQCDDGYVRGPNNQCILRKNCPKKCHRKRTTYVD